MVETRALIVCLGVMVVGAAWVVWERNEKIPTEPVDRPTLVTNNVLNLDDSIKPVVSNLHVDGANSITPKISMSTLFNRPSGALFDVARHCHNLLWKREDVAGSIAACARSNDSGERAECSQQDYLLRKKLAQIVIDYPQDRLFAVANADAASEWCLVAVALDAELTARSERGTRQLAADVFLQGYMTTALEPDELLVEVRLPALAGAAAPIPLLPIV